MTDSKTKDFEGEVWTVEGANGYEYEVWDGENVLGIIHKKELIMGKYLPLPYTTKAGEHDSLFLTLTTRVVKYNEMLSLSRLVLSTEFLNKSQMDILKEKLK